MYHSELVPPNADYQLLPRDIFRFGKSKEELGIRWSCSEAEVEMDEEILLEEEVNETGSSENYGKEKCM